jgi:hypothetical protein
VTVTQALANNWTNQEEARPSYLRGGASTESDDRPYPRLVPAFNSTSEATVIPIRCHVALVRTPTRASLQQRYARMARQDWFRQAYEGKSLGETLKVED